MIISLSDSVQKISDCNRHTYSQICSVFRARSASLCAHTARLGSSYTRLGRGTARAGYSFTNIQKMSNHFTLKPDCSMNDKRRGGSDDFRITAPNVMFEDSSAFMKKECLLFYYPDCEGLAKRIAAVSGGNVELAEISWKYVDNWA